MKIYEYSIDMNVDFSSCVVALGLFDGVHKGHRALIDAAKRESEKKNLPLAVFTFFSESELPKSSARLYSTKIKNELFEKMGVEHVIYADFKKISNVAAESFVCDILIKKLGARVAVTGLDFRFGKMRKGDTVLLSSLMTKAFGECIIVQDEEHFGKKISTSLIKELLSKGKTRLASELLGETYFIEGEIVQGDGRGAKLGIPTVNISLQKDKNFIKEGVYYSRVIIDKKAYTGITNIGKCPTFEEREVHAETFILDFSKTVYGKWARIYLIEYLREERRFENAEELLLQIKRDSEKVKSIGEGDFNGR